MFGFNCLLIYLFVWIQLCDSNEEFCSEETHLCSDKYSEESNEFDLKSDHKFKLYLIYDQNFGEGFNLRRDIFIRMALMVSRLSGEWTLVLPKWSLLPHWKNGRRNAGKAVTDWKTYFDVQSLNRFVSVIEFNDFLNEYKSFSGEEVIPIDVILSLEHFEDSFESKDWSERHSMSDCNQTKHFETIDDRIVYLYEDNKHLKYNRLVCLKLEGFQSTLRQIIEDNFSEAKTIFISNAEIVVNNEFGSKDYWSVRRSMRFSADLISIANTFRKQFLNSDDSSDKTIVDKDWRTMKRSHGQAVGGPYLSAHLRRSDFAKWRSKDVPNIECAAEQIEYVLNTFVKSNSVFIASDANQKEWSVIEQELNNRNIRFFRFQSDQLSDGQTAIVDQWIAVHGMVFLGTYDSTFSFRIQEEREILGFSPNTTFNAFCADCGQPFRLCKQESQWKIVY